MYPTDLTDAPWEPIEPLVVTPPPGNGRPEKANVRRAVNGVLYVLRTGGPMVASIRVVSTTAMEGYLGSRAADTARDLSTAPRKKGPSQCRDR